MAKNQPQKKNKTTPSSAGWHADKFKRAFSESANQRYFEKKLRAILRNNGERAAREYATRYPKFGLETFLDGLLSGRTRVATEAFGRGSGSKVSETTPQPAVGPGAAGRDLPPIVLSLGEKFAELGITPDKFPETGLAAFLRKPVAKREREKVISPDMSRVEPDRSAPLSEVLGPLLS